MHDSGHAFHQAGYLFLHRGVADVGQQQAVAGTILRQRARHERKRINMPVRFMRIAAEALQDAGVVPVYRDMDMFLHG